MVGSAGDVDRMIGRARTVVIVAVLGLLAMVLLSSPDTLWVIVAGLAAVAAVVAMWVLGRSATTPSNSAATPAGDAAEPLGGEHEAEAVSRFVVSLARRNGGLVDQQLALLDTLEASVEDPTLLSNYFKLDHLATRMRRNADSLLVLAGVDRPGVRMPQDIDEVVRAGISEIEEYRRIDVLALEHVQVTGFAATTLGHLVAELLDNATAFSAPDTRVRIAGNAVRTGYEILVADSGIGIAEGRLADLNGRLALAPELATVSNESIGLTVVAKLAARIGATVALSTSDLGGTVATIHIPTGALHAGESPEFVPVAPVLGEPAPMAPIVPSPTVAPVAAVAASTAAPVFSSSASVAPSFSPSASTERAMAAASPLPEADSSTEGLQAASAAAIAKLTLTVAGLPVRSTAAIAMDEAVSAPLATSTALPSRGDTVEMSWPPPAAAARGAEDDSGPTALQTALGALQIADSSQPRPVVEAQPARIGAALASFARQSAPAWEPLPTREGTSS